MARRKPPAPNVKKFGAPLYASAWIDDRVPLVAGGGGKKSSGIPNRVMLATFDGVELTEPLASVHTDETAPQVLCAHPYGAELLVAFSGDVAVYVVPSFGGDNLLLTNLTGHPAVVLPNGFRSDGTPTSITFQGRLHGDDVVLAVAHAYQRATDFHRRRPVLG